MLTGIFQPGWPDPTECQKQGHHSIYRITGEIIRATPEKMAVGPISGPAVEFIKFTRNNGGIY